MRINFLNFIENYNQENGISLYIQGCPHQCKDCPNPNIRDFNKGHLYTSKDLIEILKDVRKPQIKSFIFTGGEPLGKLTHQDFFNIYLISKRIKETKPNIKIWLFTGYRKDQLPTFELKYLKYIDTIIDDLVEKREFFLKYYNKG